MIQWFYSIPSTHRHIITCVIPIKSNPYMSILQTNFTIINVATRLEPITKNIVTNKWRTHTFFYRCISTYKFCLFRFIPSTKLILFPPFELVSLYSSSFGFGIGIVSLSGISVLDRLLAFNSGLL